MLRSLVMPTASARPTTDPVPRPFGPPATDATSDGPHTSSRPADVLLPRRMWLIVLGVCLCLGLAEAAQSYWLTHPDPGPNRWWRALCYGLGVWGGWILLWLIAAPLAHRFPLTSGRWRGRLALHLAAAAGCALLKIVLDYPIIKTCYCPTPEQLTFPVFLHMALTGYFLRYVLLYGAMVGLIHARDYYAKFRDGQLRAARLESGLTNARLQLLKSQLHPHFLFNTLNAISALVHTDVEAADRMLARLGDLLRLALEDFDVQEAPLARELEIVRSYLEIEQARLGPRLCVSWDVRPETLDARVPTFLLQPLVENAIRHGIAPRSRPGRLEIRAWRAGPELHLEVRDDGDGLTARSTGGGVGLANTRARLFHLYGSAQRLNSGRGPALIFVTAYDCYALPAFEVHAVDYLLKPFDRERFHKALVWARTAIRREQSEASAELPSPLGEPRSVRRPLERITIKTAGRVFFLKTADLDWIEAAGNYLRLHAGTTVHSLRETMNNLESRLDPDRFWRIHRSTIVNVERIRELQPLFHGDYVVILRDGTELPLSRTYRRTLPGLFGESL